MKVKKFLLIQLKLLKSKVFVFLNKTMVLMSNCFDSFKFKFFVSKNNFKWSVKRMTNWYLSIVYFIVLILLTVGVYFFSFNIYISQENIISILTGSGTLIASVIAIGFSISMIVIQHSSNNLPARFYRVILGSYIKDQLLYFVTSIFVVSLYFLSVSRIDIPFLNIHHLLSIAILLIGLSLYFIWQLMVELQERLDPYHGIKLITSNIVNSLDNLKEYCVRLSEFQFKKLGKKYSKEDVLTNIMVQQKPYYLKLSRDMDFLFDYHDMQIDKKEFSFAFDILDCIDQILNKYFQIRSGNSLSYPTLFLLTSLSDSQEFLNKPLDRYFGIGKSYIDNDNLIGIRKVVWQYVELYKYALQVEYNSNKRKNEHPDAEHVLGYLTLLSEYAIIKKNEEALFQISLAFGYIGELSSGLNHVYELETIYKNLLNIIKSCDAIKQQTTINTAVESFCKILSLILRENNSLVDTELTSIFDSIEKYSPFVLISLISKDDISLSNSFVQPYQLLFKDLLKIYSQIIKGNKKNFYRINLLTELFARQFRKLSEIMNVSLHEVGSLMDLLSQYVDILYLIKANSVLKPNEIMEIEKLTRWLSHLPYWFINNSDKFDINVNYWNCVNTTGYLGLKAIDNGLDDLSLSLFDNLISFAMMIFEKSTKDRFGFDEPRTVEIACYVGTKLLIKDSKNLDHIKEKINEYEVKYLNAYFSGMKAEDIKRCSIKPNQLMNELYGLLSDSDGIQDRVFDIETPFTKAKSYFIKNTKLKELKLFMEKVWGVKMVDN